MGRRITFKDCKHDETITARTNTTELPSATIAALCKNRWHVKLFIRWMKLHRRTQSSCGMNTNAVKTHIWISVSCYLLWAIIRKRLRLIPSRNTLSQMIDTTLIEKIPSIRYLSSPASNQNRHNHLAIWIYLILNWTLVAKCIHTGWIWLILFRFIILWLHRFTYQSIGQPTEVPMPFGKAFGRTVATFSFLEFWMKQAFF